MEPASGQENQRECERGGGVDRADAVRIGVAEARAALIREEIANNFLKTITTSAAHSTKWRKSSFVQLKTSKTWSRRNLYMNNLPPKPSWMSDADYREQAERRARLDAAEWLSPDDVAKDWDVPQPEERPNGHAAPSKGAGAANSEATGPTQDSVHALRLARARNACADGFMAGTTFGSIYRPR
jgi:hypothetical protein